MASWCLGEINVCPIIPSMLFFYHMASSDKQVFPSLEFIGWYTVAPHPTARHIALHEQVSFCLTKHSLRILNSCRSVHRILLITAAAAASAVVESSINIIRCQRTDASLQSL